jgi:hypothetical protein
MSDPGPFGNPDGSRAAIEEVLEGFVNFGSPLVWGGLARDDDRKARVIVGRKGSGKTVYLRRLQAAAVKEDSLYADDIQQRVPSTESIVRFCQLFEGSIVDEKWTNLWRCAILSSVVSHLLNVSSLTNLIPPGIVSDLKKEFEKILPIYKAPVTAYSQITQIIETNHTANMVRTFFNNPLWSALEWMIGEALKHCPPLCFFIDAVDEEFEHAPMYWLKCQLGLFYETMRMLREQKLGGRLHIFICIRDLVLSSVLRSEHRTRYFNEPHIRILNWNRNAISHLLTKKIEMLDDEHFLGNPKKGKTLTALLGRETIKNSSRDTLEPVEQYLLRHTRLLPRDIIILGNRLCEEIQKAKRFSPDPQDEILIRSTVSEVARFIGDEQLIICGNQITSNAMPGDAARKLYSSLYTGDREYIGGVSDDLKKLISEIGKDRFSKKELENSRKKAADLFGESSDPYSVLWQNGMLGYCEKYGRERRIRFYSEEKMDEFRLPLDKDEYVFHSCLIDSVGIDAVGHSPVM